MLDLLLIRQINFVCGKRNLKLAAPFLLLFFFFFSLKESKRHMQKEKCKQVL